MSNVETAKLLLKIAAHDLGYDDYKVVNSSGYAVPLMEVFEPNVWLSSIMLNIDRASVLMFDCRAFDVFYIADSQSADGLRVIDADSLPPLSDTSTYNNLPVFNTKTGGESLHYTLVRGGLADSLLCNNKTALLRNLSPSNITNGDLVRFPDKNSIALYEFAGHFISRNREVISRLVGMFDSPQGPSV